MKNKPNKTKTEIKGYAVYFALIFIIAATIVFLFQNVNKIKTTGKAAFITSNPADCSGTDNIVFKISDTANAHAGTWQSNYWQIICSTDSSGHVCNGDNIVIRL